LLLQHTVVKKTFRFNICLLRHGNHSQRLLLIDPANTTITTLRGRS